MSEDKVVEGLVLPAESEVVYKVAPRGYVRVEPRGEFGVMYIRAECIDGVLGTPSDIPIITLEPQPVKFRPVIVGVFGGKQLAVPVENDMDDILNQLEAVEYTIASKPQLMPSPIDEEAHARRGHVR